MQEACRSLLVLLLLIASSARAAPVSMPSNDHRVIVHYADVGAAEGASVLEHRVRELQAKQGVLQVKGLPHLGMAVVVCSSEEAEERLIDELGLSPEVESATPDTWVHFDRGTPEADGVFGSSLERPLQNLRKCSAQSGCAALGLAGNCCPASDGTFLACCDGPTAENLVSLKTFHGKYVGADANGEVVARSEAHEASETFQLFFNDDGSVSFRSTFGKYVGADRFMPEIGGVFAKSDLIGDSEKFELIQNQDKTISLKSRHGWYVVAQEDGTIYANRRYMDEWEKFQVVHIGGPAQRFPNDANFSSQWAFHHWQNKDMDAPEAWREFTGEFSAGIIVAIIDTGIDYTHEDLRENMWVNPGEIPGNGVDDDGNGYIDDIYGADFANDDGDPFDDQMHGTHCAGIIAGVGNNGIGVAGLSWRGVRLMGLKFLSADGSGRTSDAVKALDYAVAHGAKIASNSWGGAGSSAALRVAIEKAESVGLLFVAAAGNDGTDNDQEPHYPSNYPVDNIVSVASTTYEGELSGFSCYGESTVHVGAPGSSIYSTVPNQGYRFLSGTSMACPHVSGLAALIWMYRPALEMQQVKEVLMKSVTKTDALEGKVITGGCINAKKALKVAASYEPPYPPLHPPKTLIFEDVDPRVGFIGGIVTVTAAADESDILYYEVYYVSGAGFQLDAVGRANATGAVFLEIPLNSSQGMPQFAAGLVAVSGNATGEMPAQLGGVAPNITLEDFGMPEFGVQAISWGGDVDLRAGIVAGTLSVTRAVDESSISQYNIYWSDGNGSRGPLVGSLPSVGFSEPLCTGVACPSINQTKTTNGVRFSRGEYSEEEQATIIFSGPATVTVTYLHTEEYYDCLIVDNTQLSGLISEPLEFILPAGPAIISWASDQSIQSTGWSFEISQAGAVEQFQVPPTAQYALSLSIGASAKGLEVVSAYGRNENPGSLYVEVVDFNMSSLPSSESVSSASQSQRASTNMGESTGQRRLQQWPEVHMSPLPPQVPQGEKFSSQEPWLQNSQLAAAGVLGDEQRRVVWTAMGAEAVQPSDARVLGVVTVPGLDADVVVAVPGVRDAFASAIASHLPSKEALSVRITRVLAVGSAAVTQSAASGGRRLSEAVRRSLSEHTAATMVEFAVVLAGDAPVGTLDRIEARFILLSKGGPIASRFDDSLLVALRAAGAELAEGIRTHIAEPQQILQRNTEHRGRSLAAVAAPEQAARLHRQPQGQPPDQESLANTEEEQVEGASDASAVAGITATIAIAMAVLQW